MFFVDITDTESLHLSDDDDFETSSISLYSFLGCKEDCPCSLSLEQDDHDTLSIVERHGSLLQKEEITMDQKECTDDKFTNMSDQIHDQIKPHKCLKCKKRGQTCGKWKAKEHHHCESKMGNKRNLQKTRSRNKKQRIQCRDEKMKKNNSFPC